jgi:hypothetical protein
VEISEATGLVLLVSDGGSDQVRREVMEELLRRSSGAGPLRPSLLRTVSVTVAQWSLSASPHVACMRPGAPRAARWLTGR